MLVAAAAHRDCARRKGRIQGAFSCDACLINSHALHTAHPAHTQTHTHTLYTLCAGKESALLLLARLGDNELEEIWMGEGG
jgi:hypothetical protein